MSQDKKTTESTHEEDIVFDDDTILEELEENKIKKLQNKLKECQKERQEFLDGWQRSQAESINIKKRGVEDRKNISLHATEEILRDLLPVLDAFDMVFKDKNALDKIDSNWVKGIEYILAQFSSVFDKRDIKSFAPLNEPFNQEEHSSIELIETNNKDEEDIVLEVVQKGYKIGERVIRPATVKVGSYIKE
jgi:molecular chaperone GrpE